MVRAADIKGTALHVIAQRSKVCNWVLNGLVEFSLLPHIFLTTSEAELHDPFLHRLLDKALPSQQEVDNGTFGSYTSQICKYVGTDPPPPDELRRRKLAVRDNLHLVTDFYVRKTRLLHHFVLEPMFDVDSYAARTEFAQRRTMSHTHELLRLRDRPTRKAASFGNSGGAPALDPSTRPKVPTMQMCFDAMKDPTGNEARGIVAFAAWMGLSAIHPSQSRADWPEDYGGAVPDATVKSAGNAALRRTFTSLNSAADRKADEIRLANRCLCHACGTYCLRPAISKRTGKPVLDENGQAKMVCRFRPEEKQKHSCDCPHCSANLAARLEVVDNTCAACDPCECDCGTSDCGCKTIVWQLPLTFRFELRYSRNLGRLQVHVRPLTHATRVNYDIQFVLDYAAVIDYVSPPQLSNPVLTVSALHPNWCVSQLQIVKYMGKPEGKSDTFRTMMANVFKSSADDATMAQLCAAAMNEVIGKRDYSDTEVSHLLNGLPIMEFSDSFSDPFGMSESRGLAQAPKNGEKVNPKAVGVLSSREEWYTRRYADLESKSSYEMLQEYKGSGSEYVRLDLSQGARKLVPYYTPFRECCLPPSNVDETLSEKALAQLLKKSEEYAEQRLVMFKPYRVRERDLKGKAMSWMEALEQWLEAAPTSANAFTQRAAAAVKHELQVYQHRQELVEDANLAQEDPETPEPSEDEAELEEEDQDDPLLLLSRLYPEAQLDAAEQQAWRELKDWTDTRRPLHPLDESSLPWISEQRELLGDELSPDYSRYDAERLKEYPEQRFAYELVRSHVEATFSSDDVTPALKMIVDGAGGTGKSEVLHCIVKEIRRCANLNGHTGVPVRVCAPTGAAASLVFGGTLHSFIRWNPTRPFEDFPENSQEETDWQEFMRGLRYLLLDERSLCSGMLFSYLLRRFRQGNPSAAADDPTAGVSIILFGDDFQLPPSKGGRLYSPVRTRSVSASTSALH